MKKKRTPIKRDGCLITERDRVVLVDLARAGGWLPFDLFGERYFPTRKKAHARLKLLYDHGILTREKDGKSDLFYGLNEKSAQIVCDELKCKPGAIKPVKGNHRYLRHQSSIGLLRLSLFHACSGSSPFTVEFDKDIIQNTARQKRSKNAQSKSWCVPDLAFVLKDKVRGDYILRLTEVDLATITIKSNSGATNDFATKVRTYCYSYDTGVYNTEYKESFGKKFNGFICLVLTTSQSRLEEMKKVVLSEGAQDIFWFGLLSELANPERIFEHRWESASPKIREKLSLVGNRLQKKKK